MVGYNQGMESEICPECGSTTRQHKAGLTKAGSQRYRCMACGTKYTPVVKRHGYNAQFHRQAVELVKGGMKLRETASQLGINHSTVVAWIRKQAATAKAGDEAATSG